MKSNTYTCKKCNKNIITIKDDVGTTPFMLNCRATKNCDGQMVSAFGKVAPGSIPTHEWFIRADVDAMSPAEFDHHINGGAFIRRIETTERIGKRPKTPPIRRKF